jgi:hypothetical protein
MLTRKRLVLASLGAALLIAACLLTIFLVGNDSKPVDMTNLGLLQRGYRGGQDHP